MPTYYFMKEMPDLKGTGERVLYPQLAQVRQTTHEQVIRGMSQLSSYTEGEVEGLLHTLADYLSNELSLGHSVKLKGIGTFTAALTLRPGREREQADETENHRNAQSIQVGGINFRADRGLIRRTNLECRLERTRLKPRKSSQKYTPEERLRIARQYLEEHAFLTTTDYQSLTGLLRTAATLELKKWASDPTSGIGIAGRGAHRVYVKKEVE